MVTILCIWKEVIWFQHVITGSHILAHCILFLVNKLTILWMKTDSISDTKEL